MKKWYSISIALLISSTVLAQMTFTGGPTDFSGQCWTLWASGDSALMGYNNGLFRTINGGTEWEHLTNGIPADVDPRTIEYASVKLIVGTNDGARIYQSDDFGDTFTGGTGTISSIAIPTASSSGSNVIMMGGTNFDPHRFDFETNDWVSSENGGITHGITHLGGDTIWICSGGITSGVTAYSHDNGLTWTPVVNEPNTDIGGGIIWTSIAQDFLKVGDRILVYTNLNGFPILYTDDYGTSWHAADLPNTSWSDYGTKFIRINDDHLLSVNLSGIWKSTDQGETWSLIQPVGLIRTMTLWNGDNLLVGTDNGVCEFDNYGEGDLIQKHGSPANASNLILQSNGNILAGTAGGIMEYNPTDESWSIFQDENELGFALEAIRIAQVGDTLYAMGSNGFHRSGDGGSTFQQGNLEPFSWQPPTTIAELGGKKYVATYHNGGGSPQPPKIFYSDDNGITYTQATWNNTPSYGYGGAGGNFVEHFLETPTALIADMNAGYAISTDGGVSWTFAGGVWDISFLAVDGADIYHFRSTSVPIPERVIEVSTDAGANWTEVPQTGLPNSGSSNYMGMWGVWNLNGQISTYNSFEETRGIYQLDQPSNEWVLVPNSAAAIENWDGITYMYAFEGTYYANWWNNGTWRVGGDVGIAYAEKENHFLCYPNPTSRMLNFNTPGTIKMVEVMSVTGEVVARYEQLSNQVDLNKLDRGSYLIKVIGDTFQFTSRIVKL